MSAINFFGILWAETRPIAAIVTRKGVEPTPTKHRCWHCYDVLMLNEGYADCDPAVYRLVCRSCDMKYLANFPNGDVPKWLTHRLAQK
jgi:hypothetical protein